MNNLFSPELERHIDSVVSAIAYFETQIKAFIEKGDVTNVYKYAVKSAHLGRLILG